MHGDVDPSGDERSLTSFVRYDTRWKPVGSLVQSLTMTKDLLVVGASMTDDGAPAHETTSRKENEVETARRLRPPGAKIQRSP